MRSLCAVCAFKPSDANELDTPAEHSSETGRERPTNRQREETRGDLREDARRDTKTDPTGDAAQAWITLPKGDLKPKVDRAPQRAESRDYR